MGVASISKSTMAAAPRTEKVAGFLAPLLERMARSESFSLPRDIGNDSRVLVIDSGDLTEILFFFPVLKYLRKKYPRMHVTYLVRDRSSELVRAMSQVSEMITYEPANLSMSSGTFFTLVKRLRSKKFNVVFNLGTTFDLTRSVLGVVTKAPIRVGFSDERAFPYVNCEVRLRNGSSYEGTKVQSFLTAVGLHGWERLTAWSLPDQDQRWGKQMVHFHKPEKDTRLIAIDPGIGKGKHRLVADSFAYLVNQLARRMPCKVLVLSNDLDPKRLGQFRESIDASLLGVEPKNIKEALALLSRADLFVSGNTDFFHFAVSMRTPTIGLFTRHDESNWFPKSAAWVQIMQGVKGQRLSLDEFNSKIDTLLHLTDVRS
jgi:ADP-heptose:LPS heptosyltransferase